MANCVFAGTFDPITKGHEEVVLKCAKKYKKVIVVVGENPDKEFTFTLTERLAFVKKTFENNDKVEVIAYSDHKDNYAEFLEAKGVSVYVRGIRDAHDYKYEKAWVKVNKKKYPKIKTKFLYLKDYKRVSSTVVKELLKDNTADQYLPDGCRDMVKTAFIKKLET